MDGERVRRIVVERETDIVDQTSTNMEDRSATRSSGPHGAEIDGSGGEEHKPRGWWGLGVASWPTPTSRAQAWSVRYAITALVTAMATALAIAYVLRGLGIEVPHGIGVLIVDGLFLATLLPLYRSGALRAVDLGLRRVPAARSVGLAILGLVAYGLSSVAWASWVHPPPVHSTFAGISEQSTTVIVLTGFAAVLSAPVVEEIFFRGFLYRSLRNRMGILPACVLVGIVFGLGHTQYPLLVRPVLASFGLIACLLYERTGSLLPGIAMHSYIDSSGFEYALSGRVTVVFYAFAALAVVFLLLGGVKAARRSLTRRRRRGGAQPRPA
jgi:membrane protease YdiL (CAAX protease family)